ncbi:hypothetical protein [Salidesulfovibrio onnuriiensis]|uniref:hypothetical protein n=1 Tax=Salidesulfovibrio onnuriiensis TaxID=2583823 RepID=UPI0011C99B55|nr:hypothetical protein [Salidesulfovibrio onnuriiensis]
MARPANLLIDRLRSRAWISSFLAELQGLTRCSERISPTDANRIINDILSGTTLAPCSREFLTQLFPKDDLPNFTSQLHRWISGNACTSATHSLIKLFPFSQLVHTIGIPQSPARHNVGISDEEFATFAPDEARQGKAFVFDFYDAPPLWTSVKGSPSQILKAWRNVSARGWLFWHPDYAHVDYYEVDLSHLKWTMPLLPTEHFLRDESSLSYALDDLTETSPPPIVDLTARIASARLLEEKRINIFEGSFPTREIEIELSPFGIQLDDIWEALGEVGCTLRFV